MLPRVLFVNLEQADSEQLINSDEFSTRFGLVPDAKNKTFNPDGFPVGIASIEVPDGALKGVWTGVTCSACHNGQLNYRGNRIRIDGGVNQHFNLALYAKAVRDAISATRADEKKLSRLVTRIRTEVQIPGAIVNELLKEFETRLDHYVDYCTATPQPHLPGRIDALTIINNVVLGDALGQPQNNVVNQAPTKPPFVWNSPHSAWVQWSAIIGNSLYRNAGETLGVQARVDLHSASEEEGLYDSTINLPGIIEIEEGLRELAPPAWPEEVFGKLDREKVARGKVLVDKHCANCHSVYPHRWGDPRLAGKRFIENGLIPLEHVGTDGRQFQTPPFDPLPNFFSGATRDDLPAPYQGQALAPSTEILQTVIVGKVVAKALKKLDLTEDELHSAWGYTILNPKVIPPAPVYKAAPLDGMWSAGPYLHNGSVPTMYDLLSPAAERPKKFKVGSEFDPVKLGIDTSVGDLEFDTGLTGNSNAGHSYENGELGNGVVGPYLSEQDRWDIIEYMKSVPTEPAQVTPYGGPQNPKIAWDDAGFYHNQYPGGYSRSHNQVGDKIATVESLSMASNDEGDQRRRTEPGANPQGDDRAPTSDSNETTFKQGNVMTPPMKLGEERVEENEAELIQEINRVILDRMRATYPPGKTSKRDAHPKTHGLVRAKFVVPDDVPEAYRHGLFAKPGSYDCLVRFSASLQTVTPDLVMQPQGMSIKVLGVPGKKLLEQEQDATTQDFVMINHPTFFISDLPTYLSFNSAQSDGTLGEWAPNHAREVNVLMHMLAERVFNPIQIQYWSQTPYRLGPHASKYTARPVNAADPRPKKMGLDFLRDQLVERIASGPVTYELLVQLQADPVKTPVEDPIVEWTVDVAPPQRVALIEIPQQDLSSREDLKVAEDLSFNVWHSLPEHQPIGSMNRTRRVVYVQGSKLRHGQNKAPQVEPSVMPTWK